MLLLFLIALMFSLFTATLTFIFVGAVVMMWDDLRWWEIAALWTALFLTTFTLLKWIWPEE